MPSATRILGMDVGSVSISAVEITSDGEIFQTACEFHHGDIEATLTKILSRFHLPGITGIAATSATSALVRAHYRYDTTVSMIAAARHLHDRIGSILFVGGEKFGLVRFDADGNYLDFKSNTGCAAGTGSFLDQQAKRLRLKDSSVLATMAQSNTGGIPKIATRCAVFAKTDLVHAQQAGYTLPEICDGLCFGLARNIVDTLGLDGTTLSPILFIGGVSLNSAVARHLRVITGKEVTAGKDGALYGALGAALTLLSEKGWMGQDAFKTAILSPEKTGRVYGHPPLALTLSAYPDFSGHESYTFIPASGTEAVEVDIYEALKPSQTLSAYLGIDIGSTSTKAVLIDRQRLVLAGFYTRTSGKPIEAAQALFSAMEDMLQRKGAALEVLAAGATGSGRKLVGKLIGADLVVDEISAHARAAVEIDPKVDTIIEIGGQDSKFTTLSEGRVTFSAMNNVCAAGTGSFIEEQALKLGCPLSDYAARAEKQSSPMTSDRCTVFMERDINHYLSEGYSREEILAAVLHSVRENYLARVAKVQSIGKTIFFQGATAKNRALVAAFEQRLGRPILVSRYCHLTGALGAALMLSEQTVLKTTFRGIHLHQTRIPVRSEVCGHCSNHCKLTLAEVNGETVAFGFLCGRDYHTNRYVSSNRSGFDLMAERKRIFSRAPAKSPDISFSIGIPAALQLVEDLPLWTFFFDQLGIRTIPGEKGGKAEGKPNVGAEFCAPMAAFHDQVTALLNRADYIFLPVYLEKGAEQPGGRRHYCYYTQFSSCIASLGDGGDRARILSPLLAYRYSGFHTKAQLYGMLKSISLRPISFFEVSAAYDKAHHFMASCQTALKETYRKFAASSQELHVVLLGRPYTVLSSALNKGIPDLFASLGVKSFFQDMLPDTPGMPAAFPYRNELHWHYAVKILEAAETVAKAPGAYPVLVTAFRCSPDAFVIDYFKSVMDARRKPYLILQLDEHDSNVGYETRIEAAVRSFRNHHARRSVALQHRIHPASPIRPELQGKTLLLPNWDNITCRLLTANLRRAGFDAGLLEETPAHIRQGLTTNTGQCLPLSIIAHEFMATIETRGLDPAKTVLWMSESAIACNIKMYPHYIRTILTAGGKGMDKAQVYAGNLSMADISLTLPVNIYFAYMFGGMIRKIGCAIRPHEKNRGETDEVISGAVQILSDAFLENRSKEEAVAEVTACFQRISVHRPPAEPKPKVAIFGDFYVQDNEVMNQDLIHFIEAQGGEVITTPYSEYAKMVSKAYYRKWMAEGRFWDTISSKALMAALKQWEKVYYKYFNRILAEPEPVYDVSPREILSGFHLRIEHTGESMDNILKIFYIRKHYPDVALFVQASPAFCCPALITEAMGREIERKTGAPVVSITYDGAGGGKNDAIIPYLRYPRRILPMGVAGPLSKP